MEDNLTRFVLYNLSKKEFQKNYSDKGSILFTLDHILKYKRSIISSHNIPNGEKHLFKQYLLSDPSLVIPFYGEIGVIINLSFSDKDIIKHANLNINMGKDIINTARAQMRPLIINNVLK